MYWKAVVSIIATLNCNRVYWSCHDRIISPLETAANLLHLSLSDISCTERLQILLCANGGRLVIIRCYDRRHLGFMLLVLLMRATTFRHYSFFCPSISIQCLELLLIAATDPRLKRASRSDRPAKADHWVNSLYASIDMLWFHSAFVSVEAILSGWGHHFTFYASLVVFVPCCVLRRIEPWHVRFENGSDISDMWSWSIFILAKNFWA